MSFLRHANLRAGRASNAILKKRINYAFHPTFDPDSSANRRVAHVAVQRRLGILS